MTREDFIDKLRQSNSAPFLFVGSGFSRHYLDFPDWKGLLTIFAPKHINEYYTRCQSSDLPRIASEIAKDLTDEFWKLPSEDAFRIKHQDDVSKIDTVFKIKIAEFLIEKCREAFPKEMEDELASLRSLVIDGIITTNWDDTVERVFPDYKPYIGQQQLISSSTFNIGEIYKIHGCMTQPSSLVLTKEDYDNFNERNPYLAAKLITIFIEHPVVFLGYSINDDNIQKLLTSIVMGLDEEGISKLQTNLIFVEWTPEQTELRFENLDLMMTNGARLPIVKIVAHDFSEIYKCLSLYERRIPANVLREYKKQFYEIVVSQEADRNLLVLPDNKIDESREIQVVYGFGAIKKFRDAVGYTGVQALDIYEDCVGVGANRDFEAIKILQHSIPRIRKTRKTSLPIYKYLREIGLNNDEEYEKNPLGLNIPLASQSEFRSYKSFSDTEKNYTFQQAIDTFTGKETWKAVALIPYLEIQEEDIEQLRCFISKNLTDFLVRKNNYSTYMRKLVCVYDCLKYGWRK